VQLVSRHWKIVDANGRTEEVKGPGVVGEQPVLHHGERFEYTSGVPLKTPSGLMSGTYQMITEDGDDFDAVVPAFSLDAPSVRNAHPPSILSFRTGRSRDPESRAIRQSICKRSGFRVRELKLAPRNDISSSVIHADFSEQKSCRSRNPAGVFVKTKMSSPQKMKKLSLFNPSRS